MSTSFKSTSGGDGTVEVDALTVTNTLTVSGTAINATEIAFLDGVTAGTVTASKAVVVDADKHIDTIVIADGGLKLGATTGTAVTSTAAELNFLDGSVAGTAVASKAAVLGTNKNLDTLVIADSGLFLGAGAGTAVTSTAAEINKLDGIDVASGAKFFQVQEAAISFSDSAVALMTIPNGSNIYSMHVIVTTGFDGTTPTYDIGFAADPDALVDGGTLSATAGASVFSPPTATVTEWNGVTSGVLIGTFVGGGSNTTGAGTLRVGYFV